MKQAESKFNLDTKTGLKDLLVEKSGRHWRSNAWFSKKTNMPMHKVSRALREGLKSTKTIEHWAYLLDVEVWWLLLYFRNPEAALNTDKYPQNNWHREVVRKDYEIAPSTVYWGRAFQIAQIASDYSDEYCCEMLEISTASIANYKFRTHGSLDSINKMSKLFQRPHNWFAYVGLDKHRDKDTWDQFIYPKTAFNMTEFDKGYFAD